MQTNKNILKLPDAFKKTTDSNNYKILQINNFGIDMAMDDIVIVYDSLDLEKATGKTLDLFGEMLNQPRGAMSDEQYRYIIKAKTTINMTEGTYNSAIESIVLIFSSEDRQVTKEEIKLFETENPCEVMLENIPVEALVGAGFTATQAVEIVQKLLPVGVTLVSAKFDGSFEFAASESEYDEDKGFATIDQTIGGTLGLLASTDKEVPLPF